MKDMNEEDLGKEVRGNSLIFDKFPEKNHFTKRLRSILCFTEEANAKKSLYNCCYTLQMIRLINIEGLGIELMGDMLEVQPYVLVYERNQSLKRHSLIVLIWETVLRTVYIHRPSNFPRPKQGWLERSPNRRASIGGKMEIE
ncbi:hypothetical protein L1049_018451 [Liquidambar formosana]|uniref:Uncharacterized protein n=1 Tax=Liquidambar formosana TaxID=63359 RepID=A0AAP0WMX8_LIQFO